MRTLLIAALAIGGIALVASKKKPATPGETPGQTPPISGHLEPDPLLPIGSQANAVAAPTVVYNDPTLSAMKKQVQPGAYVGQIIGYSPDKKSYKVVVSTSAFSASSGYVRTGDISLKL
ncbi:MAG TPA: hypothetical protein VF581_07665 [Flavobacterium sp.]|jgi:hypothetical protein